MVALEISTQRRSSKHQPGNASVDPTFESRECPVECRNHQEVCGQASGRNGQVPNVVDLPAKSPASVLGNGLFHGSYASLANPLHLCDFESFPSASGALCCDGPSDDGLGDPATAGSDAIWSTAHLSVP